MIWLALRCEAIQVHALATKQYEQIEHAGEAPEQANPERKR